MTDEKFSFKTDTEDILRKDIMHLHDSNVTLNGDTSVNILKSTVDMHLRYITNILNFSVEEGYFAHELKLAEVSPIFKKRNYLDKEN